MTTEDKIDAIYRAVVPLGVAPGLMGEGSTGGAINSLREVRKTGEDLWWERQPTEVQELRAMVPGSPERHQAGKLLFQQGYVLLGGPAVFGYDPVTEINRLTAVGYTWVPAYGQAQVIETQPGLTPLAGKRAYDTITPPPGARVIWLAKELESTK